MTSDINATAAPDQESMYLKDVTFFRLQDEAQKEALSILLETKPFIKVYDQISRQVRELVITRNPTVKWTDDLLQQKITSQFGEAGPDAYGVWVYYPWSERLVHILDEEEFIELRTSRNQYKITAAEQKRLSTKKIGVIGLSVGQSAALTLAIQRVCGEIRIGDFDLLDLSNLNRIRAGVHSIGLPKTTIVAREIAEIDPFLKVSCFDEGITEANIDLFLLENGQIDILVEECDAIDVKVLCRHKARAAGIPVVMDTSDRGLADIERFDLDPDLPILHGLIPDSLSHTTVKQFTGTERMQLVHDILDFDSLSARMRLSLPEIGKTITTWPQLAADVVLGGAIVAYICCEIGLERPIGSGRYYVDMQQVFHSNNITV